jgi:adenylosuccinate synthase
MRRTFIDARCLVITPPQQIANRVRERARGAKAHGTCGMGVGECVADDISRPELSLFARDLCDAHRVGNKLEAILDFKREQLTGIVEHASPDELRVLSDPSWIDAAVDACARVARGVNVVGPDEAKGMIRNARTSVFEGAQGVLLDERFGFHPHTTWSTTTFANADALLDESGSPARRQRLGVIRTYMTRHGAGPFPTHRAELSSRLPEPHNADDGCQGPFRRGVLDLVLLRYAIAACGRVDGLALTHLDRIGSIPSEVADAYTIDGKRLTSLPVRPAPAAHPVAAAISAYASLPRDEAGFVNAVAERLATPVAFTSGGPTFTDKRESP